MPQAKAPRVMNNPLILFGLFFLSVALVTRLVLTVYTGVSSVPVYYWPGILGLGLWFDLGVLAWLLVPMLIYEALLPKCVRRTRFHRGLRRLWFVFVVFILLFGAISEFIFWAEFSARFNFIAVDYLIYTQEVIGNIRESYPVVWILSALALLAGASVWRLRHRLRAADAMPPSARWRWTYLVLAVILPWLSFELADIDQMAFSSNVFANELSGNGLMTFMAAFRRNGLSYERFYATLPEARAHAILAGLDVEREPMSKALHPDDNEAWDPSRMPFSKPPRNIVLISVESLSASYLGSFGNTQGLTPRLDQLAREGLLFTQLYATGTRTVRGLEALALGTPPIPGQAIVRRPNNDHLETLGNILRHQGYETFFFYGGYGYFDNMNAFFAGNDYRVVDRTRFPKSSVIFSNIWGVADESLFDNALSELDKVAAARKPFLAQIMTTSNHRPFTYPDGRIDIPSPGGREGGVKYTDYAIGRFIDRAKAKPWFKDTLFVIVADHCASVAGKTKLPVSAYHIPMIMYAPAVLEPGRYERLMSQLDVPPTLIEALGLPGDDHFFGQSVFERNRVPPRAFISNYQELGYYKKDQLIVLGPKKRVEAYAIDPRTGEATPTAVDELMRDEAVAYYQSAFLAFKRGELKMH